MALLVLLSTGPIRQIIGQPLQSSKDPFRCKITVDSDKWAKSRQSVVYVTIENISQGDVQLSIIPQLELTKRPTSREELKREASKYWAPIDLAANSRLIRKGRSLKAKLS